MNAAHLHLILNHVPVITTFFSVILIIWGYWSDKRDIINIAFWGFIIAAASTIPVFLSGSAAEEIVENMPGVSENVIGIHEEMAEIALWVSVIMGLLAFAGLYMEIRMSKYIKQFLMIYVLFCVITTGLLSYTGYLGGHIRHPEIAGVSQTQNSNQIQSPETNTENDD